MDSADALYGWPAAALGVRFQKIVKRIQEVSRVSSWTMVLPGRQVAVACHDIGARLQDSAAWNQQAANLVKPASGHSCRLCAVSTAELCANLPCPLPRTLP
jgi:hypothetical protein